MTLHRNFDSNATGITIIARSLPHSQLTSAYDRTNQSQPASPYPRTEGGEALTRLDKISFDRTLLGYYHHNVEHAL